MTFVSYSYLIFLVAAWAAYWSLPGSWRKPFLLLASYLFYGLSRWDFAALLLAISVFNWAYARWVMSRFPSLVALTAGIGVNLLPLVYFKYAPFFVENAASVFNLLGGAWHPEWAKLALPLGISFITFQNIAYLFDVAVGEEPLKNPLDFLLFTAFWPKVAAGPIVRADELRDQLATPRALDYADYSAGCRRIVCGLFKKVVLANTMAPVADMVFGASQPPGALDCVVGTLAFGLQVYLDFSAYTDIALGSARLLGFRLPENFDWPYLARSPQEFWNRWHITLSRWIRDYLFTPLAFASRNRPGLAPLWLVLSMVICGFWHDATWPFIAWGAWHGVLLALNTSWLKGFFPAVNTPASGLRTGLAWLVTFAAVQLGWVLFRARSLTHALAIFGSMAQLQGGLRPTLLRENSILLTALLLCGVLAAHLLPDARWWRERWPRLAWVAAAARPAIYTAMLVAVVVLDQEATAFVYFQF